MRWTSSTRPFFAICGRWTEAKAVAEFVARIRLNERVRAMPRNAVHTSDSSRRLFEFPASLSISKGKALEYGS